jgi:hypothetical protein
MGKLLDNPQSSPLIIAGFNGGMRMDIPPEKLAPNEYVYLINGRSRHGRIKPVKLPKQETLNLPLTNANYQGCYDFGTSILIFVNGQAFMKDYANPSSYFSPIPGFDIMHTGVDQIHAQGVPSSIVNYQRVFPEGESIAQTPAKMVTGIDGSKSCIICQDGHSRPRLVFSSSYACLAFDFSDWTKETPEYVPKGKQMLYSDGKLYIVSIDGKEVYHSVTGQPLNFIVATDNNADKMRDSLYEEEASRVSFKAGYEPITCLASVNIKQDNTDYSSFFIGTAKSGHLVTPLSSYLIFGEPYFTILDASSIGVTNDNSFISLLNDYSFISPAGIHTYNSVAQYKRDGHNEPVYQTVASLFEGVTQDSPASYFHDLYAFYSVNTIYGHGILVYDALISKFVALDIYPGIGPIRQFCSVYVNGVWRLFFNTATGFYEAFAGDTAECKFYPAEFSTANIDKGHKIERLQFSFQNVAANGTLKIKAYADQELNLTQSLQITHETGKKVSKRTTMAEGAQTCLNIGMELAWSFSGELTHLQITDRKFEEGTSREDQGHAYRS